VEWYDKGRFFGSTYHIQKEMEEANKAECSTRSSISDVWRKIWKMHVPNVEKNFLCKACHDILPTHDNLHMRKVIEDPACPICEIESETAFHILWQCLSAMDVWCEGVHKFQKSSFRGPKLIHVVEGMFNLCDGEEMRTFVRVVRRIWLRRNEVVHEGIFPLQKRYYYAHKGHY
jgi:transcription elongation factor Elf1